VPGACHSPWWVQTQPQTTANRIAGQVRERLVEAAGIEPFSPMNPNSMMANDFGFSCVKTFELPRRFFSPGVPSSPLESSPVLEIFWRRRHHVEPSSRLRLVLSAERVERLAGIVHDGERETARKRNRATPRDFVRTRRVRCDQARPAPGVVASLRSVALSPRVVSAPRSFVIMRETYCGERVRRANTA